MEPSAQSIPLTHPSPPEAPSCPVHLHQHRHLHHCVRGRTLNTRFILLENFSFAAQHHYLETPCGTDLSGLTHLALAGLAGWLLSISAGPGVEEGLLLPVLTAGT